MCRSNQLEVWSRNEDNGFELRWQKASEEAVVECAVLRSSDTILYSTFSGKLLCLDVVDSHLRKQQQPAKQQEDLRPIVDVLEKLIDSLTVERNKIKAAQLAKVGPRPQKYRLTHSVSLNPSLQSYRLEVNCSLPIKKAVLEGAIRLKTDKPTVSYSEKVKDVGSVAQSQYLVSLEEGGLNPSF